MAEVTPPLFQTIDSVYTAADLGLPYRDIISEGVVVSTDLAVTERGAGANMSVDVAAGICWVKGDDSALQPIYRCYNDATKNLTVSAADGTNPRIDLVIAEVRDAAFSGVSTDWRLRVVTGTPAGSPSAPSTPNNAIVLARVSVPASDTTISNAQITDYRPRAGLYGALAVPTVTALPTQPYDGQVVDYLADATNGVIWRLKYRAASASAYKWEFVGGSGLFAESTGQDALLSSTSYADWTGAPSLTAPLGGEYLAEWRGQGSNTVATSVTYYALKIGSAATSNNDAFVFQPAGNDYIGAGPGARRRVKEIAAGEVVKLQYKVNTGNASLGETLTNQQAEILLTPRRVG